MSDFPFSIPRRGDADVVNGVSYAGTTLTLTRAEGSDLTTTIATGDPTKIENGDSKMEIATADGACVFTPNDDAAKKTTFAADGNITAGATVKIPDPEVTTTIDNDIPNIAPTSTYTHFDRSLRFYRSSGDYREYEIGILGNNTTNGNILAFGGHGGGLPDPNIFMGVTSGGNLEIAGSLYAAGSIFVGNYLRPRPDRTFIQFLAPDSSVTGGDKKHYFRMTQYSGASAQLDFVNLSGDNNCQIRAASYSNISDDRTKLNETPIENAMDTLKKLNPVTYDYYGNLECSGEGEFSAGLVAQEIWYKCPELRFIISTASDASLNHDDPSDDDWGTKAAGVNYTAIQPYMLKAIQDQQTTIEKLEERLAALENK